MGQRPPGVSNLRTLPILAVPTGTWAVGELTPD
ncbi:CASP8 and FADD-like apoptosis regulator, isoform CRA_c [Rattus norvegicus]|uniref:CASP8 and FADD-like apoptosis regulator, isoform CRA_c n=1 Tax=Rattus norvegicus TaxID=10116 RepID=A6IP77_RAT|nr:CASP8 and FADD-like apoptosis regulator, isoform CRA_c [Rattus norvegicus]